MKKKGPSLRRQLFVAFDRACWAGVGLSAVFLASVYAFPSGSEFMQDNGLDPALAGKLSDSDIRVRERTFFGKLHVRTDFMFDSDEYAKAQHPLSAYALKDIMYLAFNTCKVYMSDPDMTLKDFVTKTTGYVRPEHVERDPLTARQLYLMIAFHEFSHCHHDNDDLEKSTDLEAYADNKAIKYGMKELGNPEIAKAWLYARAIKLSLSDGAHDTALFVDARTRGQKQPDTDEAIYAGQQAYIIVQSYQHDVREKNPELAGDLYKLKVAAARLALKEDKTLNELTRRRIELFVEAAEYFTPSLKTAPAKTASLRPAV